MAEPISTAAGAITLAALFKLCIGAFELLRCAKSQEIELKKLDLKLNIEKCRLIVWGESMGSDFEQPSQDFLRDCKFHDVVWDALQLIRHLLPDSQGLSNNERSQRGMDRRNIGGSEELDLEWTTSGSKLIMRVILQQKSLARQTCSDT